MLKAVVLVIFSTAIVTFPQKRKIVQMAKASRVRTISRVWPIRRRWQQAFGRKVEGIRLSLRKVLSDNWQLLGKDEGKKLEKTKRKFGNSTTQEPILEVLSRTATDRAFGGPVG